MNKKMKILLIIMASILVFVLVFTILMFSNRQTYIVKFDSNGGTEVASQNIKSNGKAYAPDDPIKTGYVLVDWELDGKSYNFKKPVTKNITLTAKWKEKDKVKTINITFDSDGGSEVLGQTINEYDRIRKPITPTKEGYVFVEWQLDGKKFDFNTRVKKDTLLKAKWITYEESLKKYNVTFDTDGGSKVEDQIVVENGYIEKPEDPTKEGYVFVEWQFSGKTFDFENRYVIGDMILTAVWREPYVYIIRFDSDGGSKVNEQEVKEGKKVSKPKEPTKKDYVFNGWYIEDTLYNFDSEVNDHLELKAKWKSKDLVNAEKIGSEIDKLEIKIETLKENIKSKINIIEGCSVDITNLPSTIEREVKDKNISLHFDVVCGKEKVSKDKDAVVVASPYKYSKEKNSDNTNYDVTIKDGNWDGDAKITLEKDFNVVDRKAKIEISKLENNPVLKMKFNNNTKVTYQVIYSE